MTDRDRLYEIAERVLADHPLIRRLLEERADDHTRYGVRAAARSVVDAIVPPVEPSQAEETANHDIAREMLAEFKPYPGMGDRFDQAVVPLRRTAAWRERLGVRR